MAFRLDTYAPFGGFFVVIGVASPSDVRTFSFAEDVTANRMTPRMLFCDEFEYLGVAIQPGAMTQDLPDRIEGDHPMTPVAQDRDSYYLNAFRSPFDGDYVDGQPVETKRVSLKAGESHFVERNQAVMVGVGAVRVRRDLTAQEVTAPYIVDARLGGVTIDALSDAVICEVWI